eukprot:6193634-Pleurochrysis_carterae.AAC.9
MMLRGCAHFLDTSVLIADAPRSSAPLSVSRVETSMRSSQYARAPDPGNVSWSARTHVYLLHFHLLRSHVHAVRGDLARGKPANI